MAPSGASGSLSLKVLYTSFDVVPAPKGASVHIQAFVRVLARNHDVTLLTLKGRSQPAEPAVPGVNHQTVEIVEANFLRRAQAFADAVEAHLESNRYDVVHFRSIWEGVTVCQNKRYGGYSIVYELNGLPSIELKCHYPKLAARAELLRSFQEHEKLCAAIADAIVTPSHVTARYLSEQDVDGAKVHVIPNGVDTALFRPADGETADLRNLLYVGTLAPWQGLDLLFRAVRKLLGRVDPAEPDGGTDLIAPVDVRLTVCGGGRKEWRKAAQRLAGKMRIADRVEFLGAVPPEQVPDVIRKAGICIAPLAPDERNTRQGCCPIKLLEYSACRKPIISADLQVTADLLSPEQEFAPYRAHSAHHLALRIAELIARPDFAATLAHNAWEKVTREFTWDIAGDRLLALYANLKNT